MDDDVPLRVDRYVEELFGADPALEAVLARAHEAALPAIQVSAVLGRFLHVLALATGARRILEIGTLGGYSALWLARALPAGGRLVTLELDPRHAEVATANLRDAGLEGIVEIRVGDAHGLLAVLAEEGAEPFDLVFIDADKASYPDYLDASVRLSRPGTLIVADNVVRRGEVLDPPDEAARGAARFNEAVASDPRLEAAIVQHVGAKGHDGMAFAVVRDAPT